MTTATDNRVMRIDIELARLSHALAGARAAFEHSPNAETEKALENATVNLDAMLDQRIAAQGARRVEAR